MKRIYFALFWIFVAGWFIGFDVATNHLGIIPIWIGIVIMDVALVVYIVKNAEYLTGDKHE